MLFFSTYRHSTMLRKGKFSMTHAHFRWVHHPSGIMDYGSDGGGVCVWGVSFLLTLKGSLGAF